MLKLISAFFFINSALYGARKLIQALEENVQYDVTRQH
jgi:hypothetical protein